jgi:hypothetical protein
VASDVAAQFAELYRANEGYELALGD